MPPLSYFITALVFVILIAVSLPLTLGFSIILWYWLFAAAACILSIMGAFRVVAGLRAPPWIGVALALPGTVWAASRLYDLTSSALQVGIYYAFAVAASLALVAAAFAALALIEILSTPHPAFRVGYGILVARALELAVGWGLYMTGWTFTNTALYEIPARVIGVAASLVEYGAFIGAAVLITMRRGVERWTGVTISLIIVYLFYQAEWPYAYLGNGPMFWLQPVIMLIGGAAVWRMGSLVRAQALSQRPAQS